MDSVIALLDRLEGLLARGAGGGVDRRGPEVAEVLGLLRMIRAALPTELHHAQRLREEAETLHRRAADEARRMILDAEAHARRQYDEGPAQTELLMRRAQMVEEAQAEAEQIRHGADDYAARVLADLEAQVERILGAIQRGKTMLGSDGR
jgi:cell division septum initiation protein DivIVA